MDSMFMSEVMDFGPTTASSVAAAETMMQFGRQSSFEDEVEKLYLSNQDYDDASKNMTRSSICTPTEQMSATTMDIYDPMKMILADPKEVTGQTTMAMKMESEFSDLEANGLSEFLEREFPTSKKDDIKTVEEEGKDTIDEMEKFLGIHEEEAVAAAAPNDDNATSVETALKVEEALPASLADEILTMEQMATLQNMDVPELEEGPQLSHTDLAQGERLLDALIATPGLLPVESKPPTDILKEAIELNLADDSGFIEEPEEMTTTGAVVPVTPVKSYDVTNVTEVQTTDGRKVIIIIQPAKATSSSHTAAAVPVATTTVKEDGYTSSVEDDSDSDWTPEVATSRTRSKKQEVGSKNRPGRKLKERTKSVQTASGKVSKRSYQHIKDRKLRKQMQNVEAARKYRDRKKAEQMEAEMEVDGLVRKNEALKEKHSDLQNEVRILKGFMKQLGILKSTSQS